MTAFGKTHLGGASSSHVAGGGEGPAGLQAADLHLRMAQAVEVRAPAVCRMHSCNHCRYCLALWRTAAGRLPTALAQHLPSFFCTSAYRRQH